MIGAAGIEHFAHRRMAGEEIGDLDRRGLLLRDAHLQRLQRLQHHPGVERREARPGLAQEIVNVCLDESFGAEDHAAERAALAVDMFGRGIDDAVGAERKRLLPQRRRENVVDDQRRARPHGRSSRPRRYRPVRASGWSGSRERSSWCWAASPCARRRDRRRRPASIRRRSAAAIPRRRRDTSQTTRAPRRHGRRPSTGPSARPSPPPCRSPWRAPASAPSSSAMRRSNIATVGIGEARIDEAGRVALEARLRLLHRVVEIALGQEQRLRSLLELRTQRRAMHEHAWRAERSRDRGICGGWTSQRSSSPLEAAQAKSGVSGHGTPIF